MRREGRLRVLGATVRVPESDRILTAMSQPPFLPPRTYQPPQGYWPSNQPPPRQNNGLAIAAIVVACVALLMGLGFFVFQAFFGILIGGLMSTFGGSGSAGDGFAPPDSGLKGTAPQVVAGKVYPGVQLADEVSRVARNAGGNVGSVTCPDTQEVRSGAVVVCRGAMDGSSWDFRVTFDDGLGHFTLDEKVR